MDLYTLTDQFLAKDVIDEYASAIWTERYFASGDVQLVLGATPENYAMLAPGTLLALRGSQEVMELQTHDIKDRLLTVTGKTLDEAILNARYAWFMNPSYTLVSGDEPNGPKIVDYSDKTKVPGAFISDVVNKMVISPTHFTGAWASADLDWDNDKIPRLTLGAIDTSGTVKRLTVATGPLYDAIKTVAEQEGVGISLYLESADPVLGYSLKFKTYQGKDRTSSQSVNPLVRLSPDMDTLSGLKEINSNSLYRNVCYVFYKGTVTKFLAEPTLPEPEGFARRVMVTNPTDEPPGHKINVNFLIGGRGGSYTEYVVDSGDIAAFVAQNAKDAFANNNYIHAVDGETSPVSDYQFGVDYGLGDIIELEGITGTLAKARVTEYIRSEDSTGEKEYPTISVI